MDLLLVVPQHLASFVESRPLGRRIFWRWRPEERILSLLRTSTASFEVWYLVFHALSSGIFVWTLLNRLHVDEHGIVLPVFGHCGKSSLIGILSRLDWDVGRRPIRLQAIVRDLVVPSLSLHHVLLELRQALLVLVVHESRSEQALHVALPLIVFGRLAVMPSVERVAES